MSHEFDPVNNDLNNYLDREAIAEAKHQTALDAQGLTEAEALKEQTALILGDADAADWLLNVCDDECMTAHVLGAVLDANIEDPSDCVEIIMVLQRLFKAYTVREASDMLDTTGGLVTYGYYEPTRERGTDLNVIVAALDSLQGA